MPMNLWELYLHNQKIAAMDAPTKEEFGKLMHNRWLTDEEKQEILKKVELEGGYGSLVDAGFDDASKHSICFEEYAKIARSHRNILMQVNPDSYEEPF